MEMILLMKQFIIMDIIWMTFKTKMQMNFSYLFLNNIELV
jgi:hypothetical protein